MRVIATSGAREYPESGPDSHCNASHVMQEPKEGAPCFYLYLHRHAVLKLKHRSFLQAFNDNSVISSAKSKTADIADTACHAKCHERETPATGL